MRPDADLEHAVENIVDGAYFNSGQCCCGIERVYVHADVYDNFVDGFADLTQAIRARRSARPEDHARADGAAAARRDRARSYRRGAAQGREGADRHQGIRARQGRIDLRGAAGAGECRPFA